MSGHNETPYSVWSRRAVDAALDAFWPGLDDDADRQRFAARMRLALEAAMAAVQIEHAVGAAVAREAEADAEAERLRWLTVPPAPLRTDEDRRAAMQSLVETLADLHARQRAMREHLLMNDGDALWDKLREPVPLEHALRLWRPR